MRIKDSSNSPESAGVIVNGETRVKWEYLIRIMPICSGDLLADFGDKGWELVSIVPTPREPDKAVYHFKRMVA